ncbi:MAG: fructosamine kinase family protein [Thiotrichales bacterium]
MDLWTHLGQAIQTATGEPFNLLARRGAGGGCINEGWHLEGARQRYFVKLNAAAQAEMFAAEADGLRELRNSAALTVPAPVCHGAFANHSYLVLEHLDLSGRADPVLLGHALAMLHHQTAPAFGWYRDNTLGTTPQANRWNTDWPLFWRDRRLGAQLELARRNAAPRRLLERGERLRADCATLFAGHTVTPALLHGDLWSGNWGFTRDGSPAVFDPAVYYGDHEADLAMMELFGHPGADFFAAYGERRPIDPGYTVRKGFYNLYHILNHFNLFGGGYANQAERTIDRLLAEVH